MVVEFLNKKCANTVYMTINTYYKVVMSIIGKQFHACLKLINTVHKVVINKTHCIS